MRSDGMRRFGASVVIVAGVVIAMAAVQVFRPAPAVQVQATMASVTKVPGQLSLPWPSTGEAALAVAGVGVLGSSGGNTPMPMASLTKMMTAYLVLQAHPLATGENGPSLTVTPQDVVDYQQDKARGDSVVQVAVGEVLTERQLLEALLLPSGDNIATLLSRWVAGSQTAFVQEMNQSASKLGMTHTHYAEPAGTSHATVSTALDQLKLAETMMQNPVFSDIVAKPQATFPLAGTQYNVNYVLGQDGIVGIKTGSTPHDGGNFAFAAKQTVQGHAVTLIGVVLGQGGVQPLQSAFSAAKNLLVAGQKNLHLLQVVRPGQAGALLNVPWQSSVTAVGNRGVTVVTWPGLVVQSRVQPEVLGHQVKAGALVGTLQLQVGSKKFQVPLQASQGIQPPVLKWRLERLPGFLRHL
ncbi:D-alanyl-D-alanine carboxypeptidase [Alicyclobacillaceae bacterium I2511]|nr:D-alanyl-D-alanine carboxypeptidase [Alicyclobacillaceae bacterium I2511]